MVTAGVAIDHDGREMRLEAGRRLDTTFFDRLGVSTLYVYLEYRERTAKVSRGLGMDPCGHKNRWDEEPALLLKAREDRPASLDPAIWPGLLGRIEREKTESGFRYTVAMNGWSGCGVRAGAIQSGTTFLTIENATLTFKEEQAAEPIFSVNDLDGATIRGKLTAAGGLELRGKGLQLPAPAQADSKLTTSAARSDPSLRYLKVKNDQNSVEERLRLDLGLREPDRTLHPNREGLVPNGLEIGFTKPDGQFQRILEIQEGLVIIHGDLSITGSLDLPDEDIAKLHPSEQLLQLLTGLFLAPPS